MANELTILLVEDDQQACSRIIDYVDALDDFLWLNHKTCGIWGCGHSPSGWHRIA